ncbi:MAG: hypothetical protein KJ593_02820 [Candidatus Omnitrophica bacterium]|nr:hypothetical protein [Candidatus Omnitrophota bacterium]
MGCGSCQPEEKKKATYVCRACGKEELKEGTSCEVKSCCGQPMDKKE